ncbi:MULTISPECIES: ECF RNA polymerase sigma factor SigK [Rathayibacter]|jgi:RNA polymerase sigma-70 factor (ECF subfamily)|uniref:RNA polymerase subunit sigma n=2 Tax=Rathayibacter festucae TaxID=110937 RepID=A0A3Q9UVH1_9MICO|nr:MULTISPECIES: ECF RNA polymerase sigma factor SigK [Rathayibacter]AZZ50839.1 RNA polymerase subunit sigma [Rathayibacter festucae DSM 15932]MCJ1672541.1 ECF RNA polymerase sigma factor SigK [Rathayibacter sp. VKM Ac-2929]MCJ1682019.1 ECF RNA polymerase sigma factor SigK [Rathayibacter sp. VKM Ac-2928]MCJ1686036.1 ECF RNA polymerase sigma factor SigK [Rathayibacter sp. VKM Ac-2927]MCJ1705587.1 ECF RNA polymerase sigma factor SigK [Rathayibacter sp. VKM Ac-2926]
MSDDTTAEGTAPDLGALLERIAAGEQAAFSQLYDLVASRVLGLITRVLVDRAQSEEVAQEVFLEIWQTAGRFAPNKGSATTWILTMAHRRAIDRVRAAQAGRDRDVRIGIRDLGRDYDQVAEQAEVSLEHEKVTAALERLTELQRQALQLAYYGGYSHSEIAGILNCPVGTIKTRLRDGMIRLREEMGVAL